MKRSKQFRKVIRSMWSRGHIFTLTTINVATRAAKAEWAAKGYDFNYTYDISKDRWVKIGA